MVLSDSGNWKNAAIATASGLMGVAIWITCGLSVRIEREAYESTSPALAQGMIHDP